MKLKFLYNTLLTIGIVLMVLSAVNAYNSDQHLYMGISIAVVLLLLWVKARLLKHVRETVRKK